MVVSRAARNIQLAGRNARQRDHPRLDRLGRPQHGRPLARDPDAYAVEALTASRNVALLAEQARALRPARRGRRPGRIPEPLKEALAGTGIEVAAGARGGGRGG